MATHRKLAAPLTTTFTPPDSCLTTSYRSTSWFLGPSSDASECFPPGYHSEEFYSLGIICPYGYETAYLTEFNVDKITQTDAECCPSGFSSKTGFCFTTTSIIIMPPVFEKSSIPMFPPKFFPRTIYAEPIHLRFQMSDLISSTPSPSITSLPVSASVRAAASTSDTGRFQISDLISRSASISVYSQSVSLNTSATTSTSVAENNGFRHNGSGQNESGRNESGRNKSGALPTAVKVGIALGIPLALLLLSGLAVAGSLIWKRKRGSSATAGMVSTVSQGEKADYPEQAHAGGSPQCPEVDTEDGLQTSELPASERQIYELPALVH